MKLSKRLYHIAKMVSKDSVLADIGCDHGMLPIYLVQQKMISKAYACDINPGPLQRAQQAIQQNCLDGTISTILTDGLQNLPKDVTSVVIAGMGFETIKKILEDDFENLHTYQEIIVQSNTHVYELRQWINSHQYQLVCDEVMYDKHYYHILKFHAKPGKPLSEDELLFGLQQESKDFLQYCYFELDKTNHILHQLSAEHDHYKEFLYYKEKLCMKIKEKANRIEK